MDYQISQHQLQQLNDLSNETDSMTNTNTTTTANILLNTDLLAYTMDKLAKSMDIQYIDPHSVVYLALATQHRLETYLRHTIEASQHRTHSQTYDQQHHKITQVQDIRKQLLAMERADREEERRRRQALADREHAAHQENNPHDDGTEGGGGSGGGAGSGGGGGGGDDDGGEDGTGKKKKKKKKEMGPGAAARNMSEDVYKQATNKTALMLAGGVRKSWMLAGSTSTSTLSSSTKPLPSQQQQQHNDTMGTHRGRPKGRKTDSSITNTNKRSRKRNDTSSSSGGGGGGLGMVLPPSMIGRQGSAGRGGPGGDVPARKVTLTDAMYALEQELDSGYECGNRALIRSYNQYLK